MAFEFLQVRVRPELDKYEFGPALINVLNN